LYAENIKKLTEEINVSQNLTMDYIPEMIPPEQTYKIFFRNNQIISIYPFLVSLYYKYLKNFYYFRLYKAFQI